MTKTQHHVIYVPGILDDIYHAQGLAVAGWRFHGVHGHLHEMPWKGQEGYNPKLERLLALIDRYADQGHHVSLVGASAGAGAVINAYIERADKITGLVYVCGKINGPETVGQRIYTENPAFKTSLELLQANLMRLTSKDKAKMTSFYSPGDHSVPHTATIIPGVREQQLPAMGHGRSIVYSLTLGARRLLAPLKAQAAKPL